MTELKYFILIFLWICFLGGIASKDFKTGLAAAFWLVIYYFYFQKKSIESEKKEKQKAEERKKRDEERKKRDEETEKRKKIKKFGYPSGLVGLDGNNIFGKIYEETSDIDSSFDIFKDFISKLSKSPYSPHIFWDGIFIGWLYKLNKADIHKYKDKNLKNILRDKLNVSEESITVTARDQKVDPYIVSWASENSAAIISNDNFNKEEDSIILSKARDLKYEGLVLKFECVNRSIIVPALKNLDKLK